MFKGTVLRLTAAILKSLCSLLFRVKVTGLDNYYKAGNKVLIVANHLSYLDGLIIALFLPQMPVFAMNRRTVDKWYFRIFTDHISKHYIDSTDAGAIKTIIRDIQKEHKCVIFPEGRISNTGSLMKVYEGPGMIADKSGAAILPIHIDGVQYSVLSRLGSIVRTRLFPQIRLSILPPCTISINDAIKGRRRRLLAAEKLYDIMSNAAFAGSDCRKTIFQSLVDQVALHGRRHVIAEDIKRVPMTYGQLLTRCFLLGVQIKRNTQMQERVAVMLPNSLTAVVTFFAMQAYGRIPAMLNFTSGAKNIVSACKTVQLQTVYTARQFVEAAELDDVITALQQEQINIIYLEDLAQNITTIDKLKWFIASFLPQTCYNETGNHSPDNTAAVLFTSGSEGMPKGVALSHTNLQSNRYQVEARLNINPADIMFNALPVFHSFGLTGGVLLPLLSGTRVFLYPSPLHYHLVPELIYDIRATITFSTDTFLTGYAKYANPYDMQTLKYIFAGAEKLKKNTRDAWFEKFGIRILEGYGVTETSPVLAANTTMHYKTGTVGRMLPGIQYRLQSVDGVAEGGRLMVKGPNIMQGYIRPDNPGVIEPPPDEEHDTGDIVTVDEQGYITITGRAKRFAKIAGEMVSLATVEISASNLWPEHQHAVISMADSKAGEAIVLITTNQNATRKDMIKHNREQHLSELHNPKTIITVDSIPLTATGKTDYQTLQQQFQHQD